MKSFYKNDGRSLYFSLLTKGFVSIVILAYQIVQVDFFSLMEGFFCAFFFAQKHGDLVIFRPFHRESPSKSIPTMKKG